MIAPEVARVVTSPAADLREAFWRLKQSRIRIYPTHTTRASSIGDPCERRLFYGRTASELAKPYGPSLQAIFDLGKHLEHYVIHELEALGAEVTQRERDYLDRAFEISAHADARVCMPGWPRAITCEVKGLNPYTVESIESTEDIRDSRQRWVRKYYDQLQTYLYFDRGEAGLFVLLNKVTGQITFIDCPRDQARIEDLLAKAARIRDAVRTDTPPPRYESDECARCGFEHVCMPDRPVGVGTQILDGPAAEEAEELIERRLELAQAKSEFDGIDRRLKALLPGNEELLVGRFLVKGKQIHRDAYEVKAGSYWLRSYAELRTNE